MDSAVEGKDTELCNMKLESADLLKRAADLELKGSKKVCFDPKVLSALEPLLLDVHSTIQPKPIHYEQRRRLVQVFNTMARDTFGIRNGFPLVEPFGSFTMDLFTSSSDLDLSINFTNDTIVFPRDKKISNLRKLAKVLFAHQRKGYVTGVLPILRARVPILKVIDCETEIECDISVENKDGISRSMFFSAVSSIDERFRILSFLMKVWAKAHNINSSKDHTMNSLSIISLVAFHLQTRNPPILPPFCALLKDGTDISSITSNVTGFKHYGKRNQESIAELFLALLSKLSSVENLWQDGLCASIYEGSWIYKSWQSGIGNMNVEDFLDSSENFARSVGKEEMQTIYECIQGSLSNLSSFAVAQIEASKLKELLFGSIELKAPNDNRASNKLIRGKKRSPSLDSSAPVIPNSKRPEYMYNNKRKVDCFGTPDCQPTKRAKHDHRRKVDHDLHNTPNIFPNLVAPQVGNVLYSPIIFVPPQPIHGPYYRPQHPDFRFQSGYMSHGQQHPFYSQPHYEYPMVFPSQSDPYSARYNQQNHIFPGSWAHTRRNI
ncbi:protein HESO1 isoform X1 [Canna indica]|uniref:Protein HESO1 isoform X1 n=1 Tax=Canna indica TaxID=4628 RepID=A0AAQ3QJ95_9LILI|nr:protein HESO1 isoform X1 [Canna indica]